MSRPYLAVAWPVESEMARLSEAETATDLEALGWTKALRRPGLQIWRRPERPVAVGCGPQHALILGRRLERAPSRERAPLAGTSEGAVARRAARLCESGWGAYLALLRDPRTDAWCAFRDPSGAVEALTWMAGDLRVLASGLDHLPAAILPRRMALDWIVIADFLRRPASLVGRCGLRGVTSLAPGELCALGGAEPPTAIWRPRDWVRTDRQGDPGWERRLRETVDATVSGLAEPYSCVVAEVSGGLDSSIVSAGLARGGFAPRIAAALHYAGDDGESDEQRWAELLCGKYGLPLLSVPRALTPFAPAAEFAELSRGARPPYAALDAARDADTAERLRSLEADALFTGKGGDAVFFQMPSPAVLCDLWAAHGPAALKHPQNAAIARWLRRSVWSVWGEAFAARSPRPEPPAIGRFAGWALADLPPGAAHPWLEELEGCPPGKRVQIQALVGCHQVLGENRMGAAADLIHPLLAQPVLELCLGVPSWELLRGGRDRGLARNAFADWLPAPVVNRRSKGALASMYARRAARSLDALRAHLLDGVLAEAGLLDRAAMEAALDADQLIRHADVVDLIIAAAVESWVRYWQTRIPDALGAERRRPQAQWA